MDADRIAMWNAEWVIDRMQARAREFTLSMSMAYGGIIMARDAMREMKESDGGQS